MSFKATVLEQTVLGNKRVSIGKYVNDGGSTGGDIATGLSAVDYVMLQPVGSAVGSAPFVNESIGAIPVAVTIVTNANESGLFFAYGR